MKIDVERARAVVQERVATPLGIDIPTAVTVMESAWVAKIAEGLRGYAEIAPDMVLAAFGGGGPFVACKIAEAIGVRRVIIPGLAAVFSAFGIGFSDIGHSYETLLPQNDQRQLTAGARARVGACAA
jgi:N-methylhydantoinase A/oxoprolinase/acetone carboxylase beta subunit